VEILKKTRTQGRRVPGEIPYSASKALVNALTDR
jgi:hypothetical protein